MIPNDKKLHVFASLAIVLSLWQIIGWYAVIVAIVVGVAKEIYDINRTGFDGADLLADLIGIVAGAIYEILIGLLL